MITIHLLKDHMHHIPKLAQIWCDVLGKPWLPMIAEGEVRKWMTSWNYDADLPIGHIAMNDHEPIGICGLQKNDGIRPDLWPWLTDLCVARSEQNRGVGKLLVHATKNKARKLGFKKLYLFVFDPKLVRYYDRFGFSVIDHDRHRDLPVTVMATTL